MELAINNNVYKQAQIFAQEKGLNLSSLVENFLIRIMGKNKTVDTSQAPDVVLSLLGSCEQHSSEDINQREVYYKHLEEKHK